MGGVTARSWHGACFSRARVRAYLRVATGARTTTIPAGNLIVCDHMLPYFGRFFFLCMLKLSIIVSQGRLELI